MKLSTITTIELANDCNLGCKYCINRLLKKEDGRSVGIMSLDVFEASLYWLDILCKQGTQKEVNLNGNGESFLDPNLVKRVAMVREIVGDRFIGLSTNAVVNFTSTMVLDLFEAGLSQLDISVHHPFYARKAVDIMRRLNKPGFLNTAPIVDSHNWAGQLEEKNSIEVKIDIICHPLLEGRGYIQKEGLVSPCCYDYRNLGIFGNVFDEKLMEREVKEYELCKDCHQRIVE